MGLLKKLFGVAAITGAAVGGAYYAKKRKEENANESDFEDFDDVKIFDVNREDAPDGSKKITITFNSKKAMNTAEKAADKVVETTEKVKNTVTEKIGEEKMADIKEKVDIAKDKVVDLVGEDNIQTAKDKVKDVTTTAKDKVVNLVGENNIETAKEKVKDVTDTAKEKVSEATQKIKSSINNSSKADTATEAPADKAAHDTMDKPVETEDDVLIDDDVFEDELEDL